MVDAYIAKQSSFALMDEAAFNEAVVIAGVNKHLGVIFNDDLELPMPEPDLEEKYGASARPSFIQENFRQLPVQTWNWDLQDFQLIRNLFGGYSVTGADPYDHAYETGLGAHRPLPSAKAAFWKDVDGDGVYDTGDGDYCFSYGGIRFPNWKAKFEEKVKINIEAEAWMCTPYQETAFPAGYTKNTTEPWIFQKNTSSLDLWGSPWGRIKSIEIDCQREADFKWYDNGVYPSDIVIGGEKYICTVEFDVEDRTLMEKALLAHRSSNHLTDIEVNCLKGADLIDISLTNGVIKGTYKKGDITDEGSLVFTCETLSAVLRDTEATYVAMI